MHGDRKNTSTPAFEILSLYMRDSAINSSSESSGISSTNFTVRTEGF